MGLRIKTVEFKMDQEAARITFEHWNRMASAHLKSEWRRVLDLGGGTGGRTVKYAGKRRFIACLDISEERIKRGRETYGEVPNFNYVLGDACSLPFADSAFDIVCCSAALHHFSDVRKSLTEIYRVLKPGGRFLSLEPGILNPFAALGRTFFPTTTHDPSERPFVPAELEKTISRQFVNVEVKHFGTITYILPFLLPYFRGLSGPLNAMLPYLIQLDDGLSKMFKEFAAVIVTKAEKPGT